MRFKKLIFNKLRNLEETYDYNISLPNCTAFSYLDENKSAIGNISCDLPDYNVNTSYDNNVNTDTGDTGEYRPIKKKSSSSSKTGIIWLCIVIGIVIIAGIIITICIMKKKGKNKNNKSIEDQTSNIYVNNKH